MKLKHYGLLCLVLLFVFFITGCNRTYEYSFSQNLDNVEKVEICAYDHETETVILITVLDEANSKSLLEDIGALKCKRHFGDCPVSYGEIIVYITYKDQGV